MEEYRSKAVERSMQSDHSNLPLGPGAANTNARPLAAWSESTGHEDKEIQIRTLPNRADVAAVVLYCRT